MLQQPSSKKRVPAAKDRISEDTMGMESHNRSVLLDQFFPLSKKIFLLQEFERRNDSIKRKNIDPGKSNKLMCRSSTLFLDGRKANNIDKNNSTQWFYDFCEKKNAIEGRAYAFALTACVLPVIFFYASNPTERGFRISFQTQFEINKERIIPNLENMSTCNEGINIGADD